MSKRILTLVFIILALVAVAGIVLSILGWAGFKTSDGATIFAGLLAFGIVWWQGHLIKKQMELQAIIELAREWGSAEMVSRRKAAWSAENKPEKDNIEGVLEFLGKSEYF